MNIFQGYGRKYVTSEGDGDLVKNFIGSVNTGSQSITSLTRTETAPASRHGWNLVGNPFPSSIDWDASGWTKTDLNNAIYFRVDGIPLAYVDGIGTGATPATSIIQPMQSFWVRVDTLQTTASLAANDNTRLHSSTPSTPTHVNTIHLVVDNGSLQDDTYLRFKPSGSTDGFDKLYDAYKFFAADGPQIYTRIPGEDDMAINSMAALSGEKIVPLGFKTTSTSGTYTITTDLFSSFGSNTVFLRDKVS